MTKAQGLPLPEALRSRFRYDPETGRLWWLRSPIKSEAWNRRYADKEALRTVSYYGYFHGGFEGRKLFAHRVAWAITHGEWPEGDIDHINGDRRDNRLSNLRSVPHALNQRNMRLFSSNALGVAGVCVHKPGVFRSYIMVDGVQKHLGVFRSLDEAKAAREKAQSEFGFHDGHGGVPITRT